MMLLHLLVILCALLPILHRYLISKRIRELYLPKASRAEVLIVEACLALLVGVYIPFAVVVSSPADFVNLYHYVSPLHYIFTTFCTAAGLFLLWGSVVMLMMRERARSIYFFFLFAVLLMGLLDFMVYEPPVGMLSRELIFDAPPDYERLPRVVNMLLLLALISLAWGMWRRASRIVYRSTLVLLLVLAGISARHASQTIGELSRIKAEQARQEEDIDLHLSQSGRNVVVIMLDRMMGVYLPYIMAERPELEEKFDGFTFYPETISTGRNTNYGSPGLYGGYDYTVAAINARPELSLREKQNEALTVLPRLFADAGYRTMVWDPPYANYRIPSDLSIYEDYPEINALHMEGRYQADFGAEDYVQRVERNFFFYSIFRITPTLWQDEVYDYGSYMAVSPAAAKQAFLDAYAELDHLPDMTVVEKSEQGCFLIMDNNTTHEPVLLQLPDYTVVERVDNSAYPDMAADKELDGVRLHFDPDNLENNLGQYHVDVAAMLALGRWFDDLREKGVYDNTRIILVSDHGDAINQFETMILEDGIDTMTVNAFLMVKDFDASGFTVDRSFMTNCDVPALALDGIVANPVNPYTGNPIDLSGKEGGVDVFWGRWGNIYENNGNIFEPRDERWYHINGDIYHMESWGEPFRLY